jgi:hypothetical protein
MLIFSIYLFFSPLEGFHRFFFFLNKGWEMAHHEQVALIAGNGKNPRA